MQLTALYEDFRANFSNGGRLRLWDCSQLQSWRSPPMCGRLVQASDPLMMAYACRTRSPSRTGRIARARSCKRRGGAARLTTRTTDCRAVAAKLSRCLRLALSGHFRTTSRSCRSTRLNDFDPARRAGAVFVRRQLSQVGFRGLSMVLPYRYLSAPTRRKCRRDIC